MRAVKENLQSVSSTNQCKFKPDMFEFNTRKLIVCAWLYMTVISENKTKSTYFFPVIISFHNSRSMTALLVMILDIGHLYIYI